jgi:hypothetical protein
MQRPRLRRITGDLQPVNVSSDTSGCTEADFAGFVALAALATTPATTSPFRSQPSSLLVRAAVHVA